MRISLYSIVRKAPAWVEEGCRDYQRRLPREYRLQWIDVAPANRSGQASVDQVVDREADQLLARLGAGDYVIALDERGKSVTTRELASAIGHWQMEGRNPAFLIGGADGLSPRCLERADQCWSLSALTFPHALVRVILAEQIYRAAMILANHPYHRD